MSIKVITFDLDNTLWDVEPALLRAEEAQKQWLLTHRPGTVEHIGHEALWSIKKTLWKAHPELAHNVSAMRKRLLETLQTAAGYSQEEAATGAEQAFAVFLRERQRVELYDKALEVLQALAGRYQLGALTNGNADVYKTDAGEYFDFAFLAEEVGASKPAPDMFHAALRASGAAPGEVLHVGDNADHDVRAARRVGMRAVWINERGCPWPEEAPQAPDTRERPDAIIRHIRDLPEALRRLQHL